MHPSIIAYVRYIRFDVSHRSVLKIQNQKYFNIFTILYFFISKKVKMQEFEKYDIVFNDMVRKWFQQDNFAFKDKAWSRCSCIHQNLLTQAKIFYMIQEFTEELKITKSTMHTHLKKLHKSLHYLGIIWWLTDNNLELIEWMFIEDARLWIGCFDSFSIFVPSDILK